MIHILKTTNSYNRCSDISNKQNGEKIICPFCKSESTWIDQNKNEDIYKCNSCYLGFGITFRKVAVSVRRVYLTSSEIAEECDNDINNLL